MIPEPEIGPTPSQTVGPFFHDSLLDGDRSELVSSDHPEAVRIEGPVPPFVRVLKQNIASRRLGE
jgi:hypothetical protein